MSNRGLASAIVALLLPLCISAQPIDREALVRRHNIHIEETQGKSPSQAGNGGFAFGMDVTGLQTFTPFNTLSDWGWHSTPLPEGKTPDDYRPTVLESYGKAIPYLLDDPAEPELSRWLKCNPHRVNLGRIGFILTDADGNVVTDERFLEETRQDVDLWTGIVSSSFVLDGRKVEVRTSCHPTEDAVAVSVKSALIGEGRLQVFLDFPGYFHKEFAPFVGSYDNPESHQTGLVSSRRRSALVKHVMDSLEYEVCVRWRGRASFVADTSHRFVLSPSGRETIQFTCLFAKDGADARVGSVRRVEKASADAWKEYWTSGAAVDLSGSSDPRWEELERRIVLSQYVLRLNEAGDLPPQESGLVNNGWHGREHWEMIWWHMAHYLQWGRPECTQCFQSYDAFMSGAVARAGTEGRRGARWPKCTADFYREWPCDTHSMLCWQQPHPIWFAEEEYRRDSSAAILRKWGDIVVASADYLADIPFRDGERFVIGPPVVTVSENTYPYTTLNPVFELGYFRYGLRTALKWADRLGLPEERTVYWRQVLEGLSDLPQEDGYYKTAESMEDMWDKFNFEHPALTGVYGWLPGDGVDLEVFRRTFYKVLDKWQMDRIWGWDYPMLAMAAARLGDPQTAVDLLCTSAHKFLFDVHGLADVWPFPYFPANGGLLSAVAMMCGGWDGSADTDAPGFPKDGSWIVKCEGFRRMQ